VTDDDTVSMTEKQFSRHCALQRRMGMLWCVTFVMKCGLPWSHRIADRLQKYVDNTEPKQ